MTNAATSRTGSAFHGADAFEQAIAHYRSAEARAMVTCARDLTRTA